MPLAIEQAMLENLTFILDGQLSNGKVTRPSIGALTGNEEILIHYGDGTITAADAIAELHRDSLANIERVMRIAGITLPPAYRH